MPFRASPIQFQFGRFCACAPANAQTEVRHAAHFVTQARGGEGAARELCDLLLVATGRYAALLADYTA